MQLNIRVDVTPVNRDDAALCGCEGVSVLVNGLAADSPTESYNSLPGGKLSVADDNRGEAEEEGEEKEEEEKENGGGKEDKDDDEDEEEK